MRVPPLASVTPPGRTPARKRTLKVALEAQRINTLKTAKERVYLAIILVLVPPPQAQPKLPPPPRENMNMNMNTANSRAFRYYTEDEKTSKRQVTLPHTPGIHKQHTTSEVGVKSRATTA